MYTYTHGSSGGTWKVRENIQLGRGGRRTSSEGLVSAANTGCAESPPRAVRVAQDRWVLDSTCGSHAVRANQRSDIHSWERGGGMIVGGMNFLEAVSKSRLGRGNDSKLTGGTYET